MYYEEYEPLSERILNWLNRQLIPVALCYLAITFGVNNYEGVLNALLFKFVGALICIVAIPFSGFLGMLLDREIETGLKVFKLFPVGQKDFYVTLSLVPLAVVLSRKLTKLMSGVHGNVKFKIGVLVACMVIIITSITMAADTFFCRLDEYVVVYTFLLLVCWFFGRSTSGDEGYYFIENEDEQGQLGRHE